MAKKKKQNLLIDTFLDETFTPEQTRTLFKNFTHLSENAENAIRSLLNLLAPKTAVELDNHIDVELLLLAAYQLYEQKFNDFTWHQRDAFCVRVIGLIQSTLLPETAEIFCEGMNDVLDRRRLVSERAASFTLCHDTSFYRAARESLSGLGGKYLCAWPNGSWYLGGSAMPEAGRNCGDGRCLVQGLRQIKTLDLRSLCSDASQSRSQSHRLGV